MNSYFDTKGMFGISDFDIMKDEQLRRDAIMRNLASTGAQKTTTPTLGAGAAQLGYGLAQGIGNLFGGGKSISPMQQALQERSRAAQEAMAGTNLQDPASLRAAASKLYQMGMTAEAVKLLEIANKASTAIDKTPETRQYYDGEEVVYEEYNPQTQEWEEYGRAPRSVTDNTSQVERTYDFYAKMFGCSLKDPACREKVRKAYQDDKREGADDKILVKTVEKIGENREQAVKDVESIEVINRSLKMLDQEKVIIGALAEPRLKFQKMAQLFGLGDDDAIAATEALKANNFELAGQLLASGIFGAGTGISERDLQTAIESVGADTALSLDGMRRILEIVRDKAKMRIERYNSKMKRYKPEILDQLPMAPEDYDILMPDFYKMSNKGGIPKGAQIGKSPDGTQVYILNGQAYTLDGQAYDYK
jgi:hypothetical protein